MKYYIFLIFRVIKVFFVNVRYFLLRVFYFSKLFFYALNEILNENFIYVKQKISYLLNRYYYKDYDLKVVMKFNDDLRIHTIIDSDIYSGSNNLFVCPKCNSICLN